MTPRERIIQRLVRAGTRASGGSRSNGLPWRVRGPQFARVRAINLDLYKMYAWRMTSVTLSQFRSQQSDYIAAAQREPVEITSRGAGRRAVVVSPDFYDRAIQALEDQADIRAAATARKEPRIPFGDLIDELGL